MPDDKYQGVMLINPGGPGASGVNLSVLGENVPNKVGAAYDWIGFDPRGVGSSQPKLSCDSKYQGYNRLSLPAQHAGAGADLAQAGAGLRRGLRQERRRAPRSPAHRRHRAGHGEPAHRARR
nr:hypothetical protein GCM10020092_102770 [Actinoplanes digitatis]